MDNVNKIISFVLGLIVVVVFIAIVTGKFHLGSKIKTLSKSKITPTVTPILNPKVTPVISKKVTITYPNNQQNSTGYNGTSTGNTPSTGTKGYISTTKPTTTGNKYMANRSVSQISGSNLSTIPNTGAETMIIPTALSMLAGGAFLRRTGKKRS